MSKVHITIGIYPNGDYKVNGVLPEHLQDHIEYNKIYRFGRALMVDGELVYGGVSEDGYFDEIIESKDLKNIRVSKCTAPYV